MNLNMSFRHMEPSRSIRGYAKERSSKLEKYFKGRISVQWTFSNENLNKVAHCHITGNYIDFFGEATTDNFLGSIDLVISKIERQLRRHKEIVKDHLHRPGRVPRTERAA